MQLQKNIRVLMWILLAIDLMLLFPGFKIRLSNEDRNRAVVIAADFEAFSRIAGGSGTDADILMERLKFSGVNTIAVRYSSYTGGANTPCLFHLETARSHGFETMLILRNSGMLDESYFNELERTIVKNRIRYVAFEGGEVAGYPVYIPQMAGVITRNDMIFAVTEPPSQTGYLPCKGIESLIRSTDYSINREYVLSDEDLASIDGDELFYRWMRSVVDRNIRFIIAKPLKNPDRSASTNLRDTLCAVSEFKSHMTQKGYSMDIPLEKLSSTMPGKYADVFAALGLFLLIILFIAYLPEHPCSGKQSLLILPVSAGIVALSACMAFLSGLEVPLCLAFIAAIVFPSFSGLLLLRFLRRNVQRSLVARVAGSTAILTGSSLFGGYFIASVMGDIRFTMNLLSFEGVVPAYIVPPAIFILLFAFIFTNYPGFIGSAARLLKGIPFYLKIILTAVLLLIIYIYLARSGNNSIIPASPLELATRKFLEKLFLARPRFKEFLIGYPSLFIFAYLHKKHGEAVPLLLPGIGAVIGGISVVNSFCHGFTAVEVTVLRTFYGLVLGLLLGTLITFVLHVFTTQREKRL